MTKPIVPWPGGKGRLLKHINPLLPPHRCYCEVFAGGAAVLMAKEAVTSEVINDIDQDLVTLYRVIKNHLDEFIRYLKWVLVSREEFDVLVDQDTHGMTDIQKAVRFYYLQKTCFGARVKGRVFGVSTTNKPRLNLLRIEEDLSQAWQRLARVTIENMDWKALIKRYDRPHTFFFADPPYWCLAGYTKEFPWEEYERLQEIMSKMKGKMLITLNDHPDIRRLFKGQIKKTVGITYTIGAKNKSAKELLITNYDVTM